MRWLLLFCALIASVVSTNLAQADTTPGVAAYDKNDFTAALPMLQAEADQGNPIAQTKLGLIYAKGLGIPRNPRTALSWFKKAAAQGNAEAKYCIGVVYDLGDGVQKDPVAAVSWYREAAEKGYDKAQYNLASMLFEGSGVAKDLKEAALWYRKAATQGYPNAQYALAGMHVRGDGVERNLLSAKMWTDRAAAQGYADAVAGKKIIDRGLAEMMGDGFPALGGGDGAILTDAIIFPKVRTESAGIRAEHQVASAFFNGWQWGKQHVMNGPDGRVYDKIEFSKDGQSQTVYFDITNWFGIME